MPSEPLSFVYYAQSGDTLDILATRFDVHPELILWEDLTIDDFGSSLTSYPNRGLIDPYTVLTIPDHIYGPTTPSDRVLPDGEVVFSASASSFDTQIYLSDRGGYLASFLTPAIVSTTQSVASMVDRAALENSINPRLLLALLEYRCGCVTGDLRTGVHPDYLLGVEDWHYQGLYDQLIWAIGELQAGYYGWRRGELAMLGFPNGYTIRIDPTLNAGTVAIQKLFARWYGPAEWRAVLDPNTGFAATYRRLFGDPWAGGRAVEPLYPPDLQQPTLTLPFLPGHTWSFTAGPHSAWENNGPRAALDFTPASLEVSCAVAGDWVVAMARGRIARVSTGVLVQDLDGDGNEHTGWALVYVHLELGTRFRVGNWIEAGELLGHPSCAGGPSSSTHLHIARKFNGEWILAGGPLPFVLDGWAAGELPGEYKGTLTKDGITITSCTCATRDTEITRPR